MQRQGISLAIVIVVVLVAALIMGFVNVPRAILATYYQGLFAITKPESNSVTLKALHKATKVVDPETGDLTYKYGKGDSGIIQKDSAKCVACHGTMLDRDDNNRPKFYIHNKMLSATMLNFNCTDCHKEVDTRKRSPAHATVRVDRTVCPICHDPASGGRTAEESGGSSFASANSPALPPVMSLHGTTPKTRKAWIAKHPRVGMSIGISQCRKCHIPDSELDFCRVCHLRGGFRPESHAVVFNVPVNKIYPESAKTEVVETKWKGYHFVVVREALEKMGTKVDSPRNLPKDKIEKLACGACHILEDWCTRCHIKHNPNWLDPNVGHPLYAKKYGTKYCFRCHDPLGSKCISCHSYVGRLD